MQVKEVMISEFELMSPEDTLLAAARKLAEVDVDSLIICDGKTLKGIVTPRDILKIVARESSLEQSIDNIMAKEVVSVAPETSLEDAVDLMVEHSVKTLPVQINGQIVGVVNAGDLIGYEESLIEKLSQIFMLSKRGPTVAG